MPRNSSPTLAALETTRVNHDNKQSIEAEALSIQREISTNLGVRTSVFIGIQNTVTGKFETIAGNASSTYDRVIFRSVYRDPIKRNTNSAVSVENSVQQRYAAAFANPAELSIVNGVYCYVFPINGTYKGICTVGIDRGITTEYQSWLTRFLGIRNAQIAERVTLLTLLNGQQYEELSAERRKYIEIQCEDAATNALLTTLAERDIETVNHSHIMGSLATLIGQKFGYSGEALRQLRKGAVLHDVGKIEIDEKILKKPARLNHGEYIEMQKHANFTSMILQSFPSLRKYSKTAGAHHENIDGTGYPNALFGTEIPFDALIYSVIDKIAALAEDRIYRKERIDINEISAILMDGVRKGHLHPAIVYVALNLLKKGPVQELIYNSKPVSLPDSIVELPKTKAASPAVIRIAEQWRNNTGNNLNVFSKLMWLRWKLFGKDAFVKTC